MKIFISVDIEGVAGVMEGLQGKRGNPEYEVARRLMTGEANAAIRGAFAGGATSVTVADSHGPMRNIIAEDLDPRARLVAGKPRPLTMTDGLTEEYAGTVLIGYHAAADNYGTLSHTISGLAFRRIEMNGLLTGEPTLFAGYAASIGVPLLAVSGDDRLAGEIEQQFPSARRITVKRAIGASATDSLSPAESRKLIEAEVKAAVANAKSAPVEAPCSAPFSMRVQFHHQIQTDAVSFLPFVTRTGPREITFPAATNGEAIGCLAAMALIAGAVL
ncbi:M55 family metallopeptidase [Roseibium litorale]|uniref:M55 family metallopeptidase n=1 Tax=Roseibium litorale TaxID=2803841 RepID=A0ABR9CP71_9HYPH|nr:M55 family metallopeptidase [Roseibium litorale]MBD8892464.1 M55 family metallopeptidase [Roseibium litorale]